MAMIGGDAVEQKLQTCRITVKPLRVIDPISPDFPFVLQYWRIAQLISTPRLAEMTGVPVSDINALELGARIPRRDEWDALLVALDAPASPPAAI